MFISIDIAMCTIIIIYVIHGSSCFWGLFLNSGFSFLLAAALVLHVNDDRTHKFGIKQINHMIYVFMV